MLLSLWPWLLALATPHVRTHTPWRATVHMGAGGRRSGIDSRLATASEKGTIVLIDVENVRGKSGFELSHSQLLEKVTLWTARRGLRGHVSLIVDHGSIPCAYYMRSRGFGVIFGGPRLKADDVIARDVAYVQRALDSDVLVVTADRELSNRCRAAARTSGRTLGMVPPASFLADLERMTRRAAGGDAAPGEAGAEAEEEEQDGVDVAVADWGGGAAAGLAPLVGLAAEMEAEIEAEIMLSGALREAEQRLRRKRYSPRKQAKLENQLRGLRETFAAGVCGGGVDGPSPLERVTAVLQSAATEPAAGSADDTEGGDDGAFAALARQAQDALLSRWDYKRKLVGRREQTGDRVIMAEGLRRQIESVAPPAGMGEGEDAAERSFVKGAYLGQRDTGAAAEEDIGGGMPEEDTGGGMSPAEAHARYINSLCVSLTTGAVFLPREPTEVTSLAAAAAAAAATRATAAAAVASAAAAPNTAAEIGSPTPTIIQVAVGTTASATASTATAAASIAGIGSSTPTTTQVTVGATASVTVAAPHVAARPPPAAATVAAATAATAAVNVASTAATSVAPSVAARPPPAAAVAASPDPPPPPRAPLRIVIVSDTHGYEGMLSTDETLTPWLPLVDLARLGGVGLPGGIEIYRYIDIYI